MGPGVHSRSVAGSTPATAGQGAGTDVAAVASLDEPTRRRIYDHVCASEGPVSRDDVAETLGMARRNVAFHLDRLAGQRLLSVSFARRTGRSGPGAGRPAKLYQRSVREVSISLPPRHYDLAGRLLAGAVVEAQASGEPPRDVLDRRARDLGRAMGREHVSADTQAEVGVGVGAEVGAGVAVGAETGNVDKRENRPLMHLLSSHGYEPQISGADIVLGNCPFHAMAQEHTELVCGMNLHLLEGILAGIGDTGLNASLDPGPGRCCVRLAAGRMLHLR